MIPCRFEYSDARLQQVMSRIEAVTSDEVGFIVTIPSVFLGKTRRDLLEIKRFIDEEVAAHEMPTSDNATEGDHRDIIDMFLAEVFELNTFQFKCNKIIKCFYLDVFVSF